MTYKTGAQVIIDYNTDIQKSIDLIYTYYKEAMFVDCRINAFPYRTVHSIDYDIKNKTPADFIMIDLDLKDFRCKEKLDITLKNTKRKMSQVFHSALNPTVLWTGNGYHIYQPLTGFVLEREKIFFEFVKYLQKDLTTVFLQFAAPYFTSRKNDKHHNPSVKSCQIRIPGTLNSKNMQEVNIEKRWDGNRPAINYVLRDFRRYLIQFRIETRNGHISSRPNHSMKYVRQPTRILWIEKLLLTPVEDYRKFCIWRIFVPYLINIKGLPDSHVYSIMENWLEGCNKKKRLDFRPRDILRSSLRSVKGYKSISLTKLKEEFPLVYDKISKTIRTYQTEESS